MCRYEISLQELKFCIPKQQLCTLGTMKTPMKYQTISFQYVLATIGVIHNVTMAT